MPETGDIGFCKIKGPLGFLIKLGIYLNGDGTSRFQHVFIVVDPVKGLSIEAQPGGAKWVAYAKEHPDAVFVSPAGLTAEQRVRIAGAAIRYRGTPYSFLDYVALAGARMRLPWAPWLRRYVKSTKHMICSQMVDQCYLDAGVHLFTDGRWPGDVTPGDMVQRFEQELFGRP